MLYLESPIGVGFSYNSNSNNYSMNDNTTAQDNYGAIIEFFEAYNNYAKNDFYIVGESYGGVYVPTLVNDILKGNNNNVSNINLKGFAVGNGITSNTDQANAKYWYANYHGFFDDSLWESILLNCCNAPYTRRTCMFSDSDNAPNPTQCKIKLKNATNIYSNGRLNPYNIYGTCFTTVKNVKKNKNKLSYLKYFTTLEMEYLDANGDDTIVFEGLADKYINDDNNDGNTNHHTASNNDGSINNRYTQPEKVRNFSMFPTISNYFLEISKLKSEISKK